MFKWTQQSFFSVIIAAQPYLKRYTCILSKFALNIHNLDFLINSKPFKCRVNVNLKIESIWYSKNSRYELCQAHDCFSQQMKEQWYLLPNFSSFRSTPYHKEHMIWMKCRHIHFEICFFFYFDACAHLLHLWCVSLPNDTLFFCFSYVLSLVSSRIMLNTADRDCHMALPHTHTYFSKNVIVCIALTRTIIKWNHYFYFLHEFV